MISLSQTLLQRIQASYVDPSISVNAAICFIQTLLIEILDAALADMLEVFGGMVLLLLDVEGHFLL